MTTKLNAIPVAVIYGRKALSPRFDPCASGLPKEVSRGFERCPCFYCSDLLDGDIGRLE